HDLEQKIAELFAMIGGRAALERLQYLVGLFDEVGLERLERLLAIPGASTRAQQAAHDLDQGGELFTRMLRGNRHRPQTYAGRPPPASRKAWAAAAAPALPQVGGIEAQPPAC